MSLLGFFNIVAQLDEFCNIPPSPPRNNPVSGFCKVLFRLFFVATTYTSTKPFYGVDVMFTDEIETRVAEIAEYVAATGATVRATAEKFGVSKSTVHKDLTERLKRIDSELFARVSEILAKNRAERHLRGGYATKRKYDSARTHNGKSKKRPALDKQRKAK